MGSPKLSVSVLHGLDGVLQRREFEHIDVRHWEPAKNTGELGGNSSF